MQAVSAPHPVDEATDRHFWLSVLAPDTRHALTSLLASIVCPPWDRVYPESAAKRSRLGRGCRKTGEVASSTPASVGAFRESWHG